MKLKARYLHHHTKYIKNGCDQMVHFKTKCFQHFIFLDCTQVKQTICSCVFRMARSAPLVLQYSLLSAQFFLPAER